MFIFCFTWSKHGYIDPVVSKFIAIWRLDFFASFLFETDFGTVLDFFVAVGAVRLDRGMVVVRVCVCS